MGRIENAHDTRNLQSGFRDLQGQQRQQRRQEKSIAEYLSSLLSLLSLMSLSSLLLITTRATAQETRKPAIAWKTDYHEALKLATEQNKPLLIDFFATWCGPCRMMDEQVYTDPEVIKAMGSFVTVKVDIDADEKTAMAYGVHSIPRNVVLNIHGEMIGDRLGFMESEEYIAYLKDAGEYTHKKIEGTVIDVPEGSAPENAPITADTKQEEVMALLADADPEVRKATREMVLKLDAALVKGWMRQGLASAYLGERIAAKEVLSTLEPEMVANFDPWATEADRAAALAGMIKDEG